MQTGRRLNQHTAVKNILTAVEEISRDKELFIAFDRDGTLVPYADRPENAILNPAVHESLRELAILPGVIAGIVSARSMALLRGEFDFQRLFIAGNYGLEAALPGQAPQVNELAAKAAAVLRDARNKLAPLARPEINAIVEDHGYSVCVHWHTVPVESRQALHYHIAEVADSFPELVLRPQPTSYEFLPDVAWDKGQAVAKLNDLVAADGARAYVFVGDSAPDEPAFKWVNERGGVSIKVGSGGENTCSKFQVADTSQIAEFILGLVALRRAAKSEEI